MYKRRNRGQYGQGGESFQAEYPLMSPSVMDTLIAAREPFDPPPSQGSSNGATSAPTGQVKLGISDSLARNLRNVRLDESSVLKYLQLEAEAERGGDRVIEEEIEAAMAEIRAAQIAEAERLHAEGKLDEAIELLGLSPSDAAAAMAQLSDEEQLKVTEDALAEAEREEDRKRTQKYTLLVLAVLGAGGFYWWRNR